MKKIIFFLIIVFIITGCKKEDPFEIESIEKCISGNWLCTYGVEIINNDTIELFKNGVKYKYYYGLIESYPAEIQIQIDSNNYHYIETEEYPNNNSSQSIYNYSLPN